MIIVAFLQNMWLYPESKATYERHLEYWFKRGGELAQRKFRRDYTKRALFFSCITGRRLKAAFGDLCDTIVWEETTLEVCTDAKTIPPAQPEHVEAVMAELNPDVVIAFGKVAAERVRPFVSKPIFLTAPHPAARQADVPNKLKECAQALQQAMAPLAL